MLKIIHFALYFQTFSELFVSFLEKESESDLASSSGFQPSPRPSLMRSVSATAVLNSVPRGPHDRPQERPRSPINPLATSTPHGNTGGISNPLLNSARLDSAVKEFSGSEVKP